MSTTVEHSFAERVAAFAATQGVTPFELPQLDATPPMRIREELVRWHGPADDGFGEWVYPGRTVIEVPGWTWPAARPEECSDGSYAGIWFDATGHPVPVPNVLDPNAPEGIVLLCPQCGLGCS